MANLQHRLVRETTHTYDGGKYSYAHYTRWSAGDDWHYEGDVYAHSLDEAQAVIEARKQTVREWVEVSHD